MGGQQRKARNPSLDSSLSPKRCHADDDPILPEENSPFQTFSFLDVDVTKSTLRAPFAIMVNETSDLSGPGLNGGDLTLRDSHEPGRERKSNGTPLGEIEGGKAGEHLEGRKSAGQKDKSNSKEPNDVDHTAEWTETEEKRDDTEEPRYEVEKIVDHRTKNRTEVELMVKWTGYSKPTLVDERTLQQDCPDALYHYWETRGTRERATGIRLEFHAFEVLKWKVEAEKLLFLVQWVGYPPKDATWEFAWRVKNFAEGMHAEYLRTHPAAKRAWEKENFRRVEKSAL